MLKKLTKKFFAISNHRTSVGLHYICQLHVCGVIAKISKQTKLH